MYRKCIFCTFLMIYVSKIVRIGSKGGAGEVELGDFHALVTASSDRVEYSLFFYLTKGKGAKKIS